MVRRLVRFEVQIQHDQRPLGRVAVQQCLVDIRTNISKEVLVHARLVAACLLAVGDDFPAELSAGIHMPNQILLDGEWKAAR